MPLPSGFPEYSPGQQIIFDQIQKNIENSYQQFGYTHIQTPAVELNSVLLSKNGEDAGKQIFGLYGLAQGGEDLKDYSLHFDLTVPFARYVLDRENQLAFPFKRYQIQPVWRGERAQRGRFREFWQCDIDVIWKNEGKSDYLYYDAETITNIYKTIASIIDSQGIDESFVTYINNKKIINGLLVALFQTDDLKYKITNLIDKYNKIGKDNFILSLRDLSIDEDKIDKLLEFINMDIDMHNIDSIQDFVDDQEYKTGIQELKKIIKYLESFKSNMGININYKVNFKIVRGLDYYTGTVFESYFVDDQGLGSISGGGSYANLTGYIDPKRSSFSGVGGTIGISRLVFKSLEKNSESKIKNTIADYMFINFQETFEDILRLAGEFILDNKNIDIYPSGDKLAKQFAYADKKGIPYVVVLGEGEKQQSIYKIKNMKTGEEETLNI